MLPQAAWHFKCLIGNMTPDVRLAGRFRVISNFGNTTAAHINLFNKVKEVTFSVIEEVVVYRAKVVAFDIQPHKNIKINIVVGALNNIVVNVNFPCNPESYFVTSIGFFYGEILSGCISYAKEQSITGNCGFHVCGG